VKHVREQDVAGTRAPPPNARTLKHLATPWTLGTQNLWLGLSEVDPGSSSNLHFHELNEEIFYVVSGQGFVQVDEECQPVGPGSVVVVPPGAQHRLVNLGTEVLKVLASVSPPFEQSDFETKHLLSIE
jgi:mannose-6-phosphate isomerase-like protein (cupin superfamily)